MKKQITHISPLQTAKVFALLYLIGTAPLLGLMAVATALSPAPGHIPVAMFLIGPFIYALFGFVFSLFGSWIYNLVARWVGGIEYTSTDCAVGQVVVEKESVESPSQE